MTRSTSRAALTVFLPVAAAMLLWPALVNGYPLLFGDTGVYVVDGLTRHVSWPRPMFYGLFMLPLHLKVTVWPVVAAQAVITAGVLALVMAAFAPGVSLAMLLSIVVVLTVGTSLPWFVSQLMPDLFAGLLVLVLSVLVMTPTVLGRFGRIIAVLFAAGCITMHLSLLPLSLSAIVTLLACRLWVTRSLGFAEIGRAVAVPVLAALVLIATNAVLIGQPAVSPYGKIFLLNRILVDGPGVRTLDRECPRADWTLCAFRAEIPTIKDEDDILWGSTSVLERAGGYKVVAPQAWPILLASIRAEPATVIWQVLRNTGEQLLSFRTGDALLRRSTFNDGIWSDVFPPAEQARYRAGRQYRQETLVPSWLQVLHVGLGAAAAIVVAIAAYAALRRRAAIGGLLAAVTVTLLANAFVAGALSGVYDRYGSRFIWLAPFAAMVLLADRRRWSRMR